LEKVSFKERLIQILSQKGKTKLTQDAITAVDKLKKQERLTENEFWTVYGSIRQEGQDMKTRNPAFYIHRINKPYQRRLQPLKMLPKKN